MSTSESTEPKSRSGQGPEPIAALTPSRLGASVAALVVAFAIGSLAPRALLPDATPLVAALVGIALSVLLAALGGWALLLAPLVRAYEARLAEQVARANQASERLRSHENDARLRHALEIAEDEESVLRVATQSLETLSDAGGAQLLVADDADAEIEFRPVVGDMTPNAECLISKPRDCPTVRRGQGLVYEDGMTLGACRGLRGQIDTGCAAACAPIFIGGRATGMVRALGKAGDPDLYRRLQALTHSAHQIGARLAVIRSMAASEKKATTDPLTGLFNRRAFDARLAILLEQGASFSLVIADIDHFKKINDTYGHDTGDRALKVLAAVFKQSVRSHDLVARFGGEEFVLLLIGIDAPGVADILERIRKELPRATTRAQLPGFTFSAGVVAAHEHDDAEALVHIADQLLYEAKRLGRNRVQFAPRKMPSSLPPPVGLEASSDAS